MRKTAFYLCQIIIVILLIDCHNGNKPMPISMDVTFLEDESFLNLPDSIKVDSSFLVIYTEHFSCSACLAKSLTNLTLMLEDSLQPKYPTIICYLSDSADIEKWDYETFDNMTDSRYKIYLTSSPEIKQENELFSEQKFTCGYFIEGTNRIIFYGNPNSPIFIKQYSKCLFQQYN